MAQKFGNSRWVKEGFLDNRIPGTVVGRIEFAAVGHVDVYWAGDFRGEIAGQAIQFRNSRYEDEAVAGEVIGDMDNPQLGTVNLISFDPHPNLEPHPYIEWFSLRKQHYRIELAAGEAWIVLRTERDIIDRESRRIREALADRMTDQPRPRNESDWV
jgi:hypothetical protein